ncbi:unnamed protein product, partial [Mesorhabditis spiculigera]
MESDASILLKDAEPSPAHCVSQFDTGGSWVGRHSCPEPVIEGVHKLKELFLSEVHWSRSESLESAVEAIRRNNNVALKGAIQEATMLHTEGDIQGLNMRLRKKLDLFANVCHIKTIPGIKTRHGKDLDFVIIREQTEGEYSALEHELVPGVIECLKISTRPKIERIAKFAFDYATKHGRKKVTAVHKANIMKLGDGLFLRICNEVAKFTRASTNPNSLTDGDAEPLWKHHAITWQLDLSEGAGVVPAESVGSDYVIFEPGSRHSFQAAFGRQIANPTAMILCFANMLKHLHLDIYGRRCIDGKSVLDVIKEGKVRTQDLGGYAKTMEFADAVITKFKI